MKNVNIKPYNAGHVFEIGQPGDARSTVHLNRPTHMIECTPQEAKDLALEILEECAQYEETTGKKLLARGGQ